MTVLPSLSGNVGSMPEISRFLGIVIQVYDVEHGVPHFHAVYGDHRISVEVQTGTVRGTFPPRALQHVLEWTELHSAQRTENWERARQALPLEPIAPLE